MKTTIRKTVVILWATAALAGCAKDGDINPEPEVTPCNAIEVSGTINKPTVWQAGAVYVIDGSDLRVESELTIEPGVVVKVRDARISIFENGQIIAEGTADKRIVFTSLHDDGHCGDTNGDKSATGPEKGDWIALDLHGTIGSIFKYVDIFYAGQNSGGSHSAVHIDWPQSVAFTFDHCRIAHTLYQPGSSSYAFYGTSAMKDAGVSKFTNNALYDNGRPIYFDAFYELDPSNVFHNPENPSVTNTHNGIYINLNTDGSNLTVNWHNTEVPYVADYVSVMQLHRTGRIRIHSHVVVKFASPGGGLQSYDGNVYLDPTAILTSYKDDEHGGDTNGDGNTTVPADGDWEGFRYTDGGTDIYWVQGPNILFAAN